MVDRQARGRGAELVHGEVGLRPHLRLRVIQGARRLPEPPTAYRDRGGPHRDLRRLARSGLRALMTSSSVLATRRGDQAYEEDGSPRVIEFWSDIGCPWASLAVHRFR